ncbi:type III-A CRISPR-associated RAMP protein Csm4 [Desulfurobacterium atlanticum]|nr:RAMP superfamily CRISPR-associated protein [Desulfurobacterium atlanticum]
MERIRIKIEPETAFASPIQSDTLFGEFCWHYRFLYGDRKLNELLDGYNNNPSIVFSDGFPENTLPMPTLTFKESPFKGIKFKKDRVERYKLLKKFKKKTLIEKSLLASLIKEKTLSADIFLKIVEEEKEEEKKPVHLHQKQIHVAIDRATGKSREGILFEKNYTFFSTPIEIYCKFNTEKISIEEIEETFRFMGMNGFGAEKTTGKGKFIHKIKDWDLPEIEKPNGFISLSTGMPEEVEVKEPYHVKFFTKFPKHGTEIFLEKDANIFKNPVIMTARGSVFSLKEKKEVYGRVFYLSKVKTHIHCGKIIPLFVRF